MDWVRRFVLFHGKRHSRELGAAEVEAFLSYLATERRVSASTQNQATSGQCSLQGSARRRAAVDRRDPAGAGDDALRGARSRIERIGSRPSPG
jgi:hypothetical protein